MFRIERWAAPALVVAVGLSAFFVWAGSQGYPTATGYDSFCYLSPAMNAERGLGYTSLNCPFLSMCDPALHRLLAYPAGFQMVLSGLMLKAEFGQLFAAEQLLQAGTVILGTLAVMRAIARSPSALSAAGKGGLTLLATLVLAAGFHGMGLGRPEVLSQFVIALAVLVLGEVSGVAIWLLAGFFIGLAGTVSPWAAVTGGFAFVWWRSLAVESWRDLSMQTISAASVSAVSFWVLSLGLPASISEMVEGASCVSKWISEMVGAGQLGFQNWKYHFFFYEGASFYTFLLIFGGVELTRPRRMLQARTISDFLRFALPMAIVICAIVAVKMYRMYVIMPWSVAVLVGVCAATAIDFAPRNDGAGPAKAPVAAWLRTALLLGCTMSLMFGLGGWPGYAAGPGRRGPAAAVESVLDRFPNERIGVGYEVLTLSERDERMVWFGPGSQAKGFPVVEPPRVVLLRGPCQEKTMPGYQTVCLPWREPGPALQRWVDHERFGWAFTLLVREDAAIDVDALVNDMMCAAGDAAKPGSCRPR